MEHKEKTQIVADRVNEYFEQIFELKASDTLKQYLDFCERVAEHSAFNNTLVFIQKPECFYYATKSQWKRHFNRNIKELARPLLVLFPFAPVEFVYDLEDTDGEPLPMDFVYWWREKHGGISKGTLENLMTLCNELEMKTTIASSEYIKHHSHHTFGVALKYTDTNEHSIELHPRYKDPGLLQEAFGVLVHEIAHHLLGHLGEKTITVQVRGKSCTVVIAKENHDANRGVGEVEAEITAWLVFAKLGLKKRSAEYLAGWITERATKEMRITEVNKAVDKIFKMSQGERWWEKVAARAEKDTLDYAIRF